MNSDLHTFTYTEDWKGDTLRRCTKMLTGDYLWATYKSEHDFQYFSLNFLVLNTKQECYLIFSFR